jgi:hypothetical protein
MRKRRLLVFLALGIAAFACAKEVKKPPITNQETGTPDASAPIEGGTQDFDGGPNGDASCFDLGFGAATTLALPTGYAGTLGPFIGAVAPSPICTNGANVPSFVVLDVDGDRVADILVPSRCNDSATGNTRWILHKGGAAGFAPAADFALPTGYGTNAFTTLSATMSCSGGATSPGYFLADLDGDFRPDLVLTSRCADAATGVTKWLVHHNDGTGFATTPTDFTLPQGFVTADGSVPFAGLTGALSCSGGANLPEYTVVDMNGDRRPDLLVTQRCADTATGSTQWIVYPNTGAGFATTPTTFALPTAYGIGAFPTIEHTDTCATTAGITYKLLDFDGDLRPELVVTRHCNDALVGASRWLVHPNTGTGFGSSSVFTLPSGYQAKGGGPAFATLDSLGADCAGGANIPFYGTFDLDGDLRPDLVMFARCNDSLTGRTSWGLQRNTGSAFAIRETFALPSGYTVTGGLPFPAFAGQQDCVGGHLGWAALDMNGDLKPDLLITERCGDGTTGFTSWIVHPNGCKP